MGVAIPLIFRQCAQYPVADQFWSLVQSVSWHPANRVPSVEPLDEEERMRPCGSQSGDASHEDLHHPGSLSLYRAATGWKERHFVSYLLLFWIPLLPYCSSSVYMKELCREI